ncbi:MAG: transglycosylase family protein [Beutenbergiaceae bacterium]
MSEHTQILDPVESVDELDTDNHSDTPQDRDRRLRPRRPRRGWLRWVAIIAAIGLLIGGAGTAVAFAHKNIELDVDGEVRSVGTFTQTVGELLTEQEIALGEYDLVIPGVGEPLAEGDAIVIRYAEPVSVLVDDVPTQVWTVGETAAQVLSLLAASGVDAALVAQRSDSQHELELPLTGAGPVTFDVDGQRLRVTVDDVVDLGAALRIAEIELAPNDRVALTHGIDGPLVTITRIALEPGSRTEAIPFETIERDTDDLYQGESRVVTEGSEGIRTYTFVDRLVDGVVTSSRMQSVEITTEPVTRVIENGTAQRPVAPAPAPASSGGGTVSGDVWAALAQCESGGNPSIVSSNGRYHGLYQFSVATWQSVGGTGLPSQASPAEQTQRAQMLQARSGWGQWPHCSSVLGLR